LERLIQRHISEAEIEAVIYHGNRTDFPDGLSFFERVSDGWTLRVVAKKRKNHLIIVTAYRYEK
jgi:hypothetical protein